jgi:acylphosphatase
MEEDMDEDTASERRGFRVSGRVQGVGFRWWTARTAKELNLGGHVRNLPDGSVEVHAVGRVPQLAKLERALHEGPPGARVDAVRTIPVDPRTPTGEFRMERW